MKKLTKILIIALSVALLCGAFIFAASAEETAPEATTHNAFRVENPGEEAVEVVTVAEAFSVVKSNGKITMIADYEEGPNTNTGSGIFLKVSGVTLDLNGHTLSASYGTKDGSLIYQWYNIQGSLTVIGDGTIKAGTSPFIVINGGYLEFNAGTGKTINFVATKSYDTTSKEISSNKFPGIQFVKIGGNNSFGDHEPTVAVRGNLTFENKTEMNSVCLFGLYSGARLDIYKADINSNNPVTGGSFVSIVAMSTAEEYAYDEAKYIGPEISITESTIVSPYGHFFMNAAQVVENDVWVSYVKNYSDAAVLTVTDSTLELYGDNYPAPGSAYDYSDIYVNNNTMNKIVMTGTKVHTDSNFYGNVVHSDKVPFTTLKITDCTIAIEIYQGAQSAGEYYYRRKFFTGIVTAIVEDSNLIHNFANNTNKDSGRVLRYTHAWANATTAKARFTDPGYFDELGMGVLFKNGTTFTYTKADALGTPTTAGSYHDTFSGYAYESGMSLVSNCLVWVDGVPYTARVVTDRPATDFSGSVKAYNPFEGSTVGVINSGGTFSGGNAINTSLSNSTARGTYTICKSDDGNKYFTFQSNGTTSGDPYININYGGGTSSFGNRAIDKIRYYSYEFDLASTEYKYSAGNFNFGFLFYAGGTAHYAYIYFKVDANGTYWTHNNTQFVGSENLADPGEWQHIQMIFEAPVDANGVFDAANVGTGFKFYLYVNGKRVGETDLKTINNSFASAISGGTIALGDIGLNSIRLRVPSSSDKSGITAMDNLYASTYPFGYTGGLNSVVTDSTEYVLPENLPLVDVDGEGFNDIDAAFTKLVTLANAGNVPTLTYKMDISSLEFDLAKYGLAEDASFNVVTGGKDVKVSSNGDYGAILNDDGSYTVVGNFSRRDFSVIKNANFEDAIVGTNNAGGVLSEGGKYGSDIDSGGFVTRHGKYTVCEYDGNKYMTHVAQSLNSDPFVSFGFSNTATGGVYSAPINAYRFYSFEFDMAPAELRYSQGAFGPAFLFRGAVDAQYVGVFCETDSNGKTIWKITGAYASSTPAKTVATFEAAEVAANAGKWQHVQVILEAPVADGAFDTKNAANFQIHLYLDGKLVGTAALSEANSGFAGNLAKLTDFTKEGVTEVRFRFPNGYYEYDKGSTALDNLKLTRYPIIYTGGETTDKDILNSVVKTNYTKLANLPVVNVNGEDFNDVDAAFAKLVTLANAGNVPTLTYKMDISSLEFDPVKYGLTENASFNVVTGGKSLFKLPALSGYTTADNGSGSYTVSAKFATVTWQDKDGATLHTDKVIKGTEISAYAIDNPQKVTTDYYVATYNYWKLGEKFVKFEDAVAIDSDVTATPVASLESNFVDFKLNIELNDNLCMWYYLPTDLLNNKVEGITFTGAVYGTETEAKTFSGEMEIGENTYAYHQSYQGYNAFTTQFKWTISYDVVFDGLTYHLSREFGVSPLSYAEYILSDTTNTFTAQEKGHIANFVRTANEFMRAYNGKEEYVASINTVYETYKHLCSEYETDLLANTNLELGDLSNYISSVYLKISSGRAQYSIDFKENSGVTGVRLVKKGVSGGMAGVDIVVGSYGDEKYSDGSYKTFNTNALKFYNFFGTLNITLTVDDGKGGTEKVTGTYDINSWYNSDKTSFKDEDEKAMWGDLLMAMKELGDSTFEYRFERVED